jgi:hypothetical protein
MLLVYTTWFQFFLIKIFALEASKLCSTPLIRESTSSALVYSGSENLLSNLNEKNSLMNTRASEHFLGCLENFSLLTYQGIDLTCPRFSLTILLSNPYRFRIGATWNHKSATVFACTVKIFIFIFKRTLNCSYLFKYPRLTDPF